MGEFYPDNESVKAIWDEAVNYYMDREIAKVADSNFNVTQYDLDISIVLNLKVKAGEQE